MKINAIFKIHGVVSRVVGKTEADVSWSAHEQGYHRAFT